MGETIKLLPCPYCGGKAEYKFYGNSTECWESVICTRCGGEMGLKFGEALGTTIEKWNSRMISNMSDWIPVKKKLPCPDTYVIVQTEWKDILIMELDGSTMDTWRTFEESITYDKDEIVAWAPLPEPYEGDVSDTDVGKKENE